MIKIRAVILGLLLGFGVWVTAMESVAVGVSILFIYTMLFIEFLVYLGENE